MNPFSTFSWFWRAWRTRSITFAVLFAFALFGISVMRWLRHVLSAWGAPWYIWLLVPFALVSVLSRKEAEWIPDPATRHRWALGLLGLALLGAVVAARLR